MSYQVHIWQSCPLLQSQLVLLLVAKGILTLLVVLSQRTTMPNMNLI